ncbi:MAG: ABC transporter ATP-binding protein [Pseudomonadota bacterium]
MTDTALLRIKDLRISLPAGADRAHAVDGVTLELHPDEILFVVGESGSGKSLLAKSIMGLLPEPDVHVSGGEIIFEDEDLLSVAPERMRDVRGRQVSMVFQEPMTALNPLITIGQQISEVVSTHMTLPTAERRARVLDILDEVHLPDPESIYDSYPHQLSGGQRQRAMIAMALILEPDIIIADEPTTALDVTTQAQILHLIQEIQRKRRTGVIFITHDFGVVAEIADRVAVMQHGHLVEVGPVSEILNAPKEDYTKSLIAAVPPLTPGVRNLKPSAEILLDASGLEKTFVSGGGLFGRARRETRAVRNVSLQLQRGETVGVVGESGSGKSTLARLIIRLIQADRGALYLDEVDLLKLEEKDLKAFRKRIQMVFQDPFATLNPRYRVGRIIAEGPLLRGVPKAEAYRKVDELLELVGLTSKAAKRFPHEFSGGQRQRIGIARALALEPEILIADEPVSALDVSVQEQVLRLFTDIRDRFDLSMLFITHDLCVAAQICDNIAVMRHGEVVEYGRTDGVFSAPRHEYTQALLASIPGRAWLSGQRFERTSHA